jgi:hypothetical protein
MRRNRFAIAITVALVSSFAGLARGAQTPQQVSYATFMAESHEGRLRIFDQITPEARTVLVVEQVARWREANRSWLTQEQLKVLTDFIGLAGTVHYSFFPEDADTRARRISELATLAKRLFSPAQIRQALNIKEADYIPWQW